MFGKRSDGKLVKNIDPIVAITPYLMPMRCDSQVMLEIRLPYDIMARYIVEQGKQGRKISFMEILIAAFVRTVSDLPQVNRFIASKRLYARKHLAVSFTILQDTPNGEISENTVKCYFDPHDTIFDVADRVNAETEKNKQLTANNMALKIARFLVRPMFASPVAYLCRLLDKLGILPGAIIDASPFHTSLFVTNVASIGLPNVRHHIYNFGTTSLFFSLGIPERELSLGKGGKIERTRKMPVGITVDERIAPGAIYARLMERVVYYVTNVQLLEIPPESVRWDEYGPYTVPGAQKKKDKKN